MFDGAADVVMGLGGIVISRQATAAGIGSTLFSDASQSRVPTNNRIPNFGISSIGAWGIFPGNPLTVELVGSGSVFGGNFNVNAWVTASMAGGGDANVGAGVTCTLAP